MISWESEQNEVEIQTAAQTSPDLLPPKHANPKGS
jgi:hypothetical protein